MSRVFLFCILASLFVFFSVTSVTKSPNKHIVFADAPTHDSQAKRALDLVTAFEDTRVPVLVVGDSNMAQPGGNHTGGLRNALQDHFAIWGARMSGSNYGSVGSDVEGSYEGFIPGAHATDFRWIESADPGTAAETDLLSKSTFTQTEYDASVARFTDLTAYSNRTVEEPAAFNIGQWAILPATKTAPADGGTITGTNLDNLSFISVALTGSLAVGSTTATLTAAWALPTKTYQMTFSSGETRPVTLTSGATTVTWSSPLTQTATVVITVQKANGKSIEALGDLRTVPIKAYTSYMIPTGSSGAYNPNIRLAFSFTNLTTPVSYGTPTNAITDVEMSIPTNTSVSDRVFQDNVIGVNNAVGKLYVGGQQFVNPAITTGAAVSVLYQAGGYSLVDFARDLNWLMIHHPLALREIIRESMRPVTPGEETMVFWNKFKGNDVGISIASYSVGDAPGTATGPASNTKEGYKRNFETVAQIVYTEWVALGYDPEKLWIIDGAYHPQSGIYVGQEDFEDGALELAETGTSDVDSRILVLKGSTLTTPAEMSTLGWYDSGIGGAESAHLSSAGYFGFNSREVDSLVDLSNTYVAPITSTETETSVEPRHVHSTTGYRPPSQPVNPQITQPAILPDTPGISALILAHDLQFGDSGPDVKSLQEYLIKLNLLAADKNTGFFGPLTLAAVKLYQSTHGITPVSGFVGPITRASLGNSLTTSVNPASIHFTRDLELGTTGSDVKALQIYLNTHGYTVAESGPGSLDNETETFGFATQSALMLFQRAHGLPGSGFFGPRTRALINQ